MGACLDVPSEPDTSGKVQTVKVHALQYDKIDSTALKINPNDPATLITAVSPSNKANDLQYIWYNNDIPLGSGRSYDILPNASINETILVPNTLVVIDKENNSQTFTFTVVMNYAPQLDKTTIPSQGETIVAEKNSPVQFQWKSTDSNDDILTHILEIDDNRYNVGNLTKVFQSGFDPGEHQFRVIVTDSYGDADTLDWVHFKVTTPDAGDAP